MFMQVIQGQVTDPEGLRRQLDKLGTELQPAPGWLGGTSGLTDDGRYIGCIRFESAEAAKAGSERPEQGAWFAETEKCFAGPPTFQASTEVDVYLGGGSDSAGFVQVIQGGPADRDRVRQLDLEFEALARQYRPDIIGWVVAWHDDDRFTSVVYFNSEEAARKGEAQEPPEEREHLLEEWREAVGELTFFDLRQPRLRSREGS
jgi:heme-degrading monooxygenase HmoA